ncbi:hypothetical protein Tco_1564726, partial [Tanacetum coccineum]
EVIKARGARDTLVSCFRSYMHKDLVALHYGDTFEDSTVTYTEVSSPFEDRSDIGSLRVDGLPMMPEDPYAYVEAAIQAPPSPDYVPGPEHPPSPDYVPGPEHLASPDYVPGPEEPEQALIFLEYVPEPEYP